MLEGNMLEIGASLIKSNAEREIKEGMSLEDKAKICYKFAYDESCTWFANHSSDDEMFRLGSAGLILVSKSDSEDRRRITACLDSLNALSAAIGGVMVDWESELEKMNSVEKPIPLPQIFRDVKKELGK